MSEIAVFVMLQQHMKYTRTEIKENFCSFKNKNKRKSLRDIFVSFFLLYLFIRSCKFVKIDAYDIAHDENAMSSLIIQSIY